MKAALERTPAYQVADHFAGKSTAVRQLYDRLLVSLRRIGKVKEDPKKTSIHLVRKSALAGVEVRKNYMLLTIKSDRRYDSPRIQKVEHNSANRFHQKLKLSNPSDIDRELLGWLKMAYELSG